MKRRKLIFASFEIIVVLILLDFSPAIWQRIYGNGGSRVMCYWFRITGDSLFSAINKEFGKSNSTYNRLWVDEVLTDENHSGYTGITLYDRVRDEYIHIIVETKQNVRNEITALVFYGISHSSNWEDCWRINLEDYITRNMKIERFEKYFLDRLSVKRDELYPSTAEH